MDSASNHLRSSKKLKMLYNGEDRISNLPDSVLVYILSFLPTKYAVGTSILSRRWKHLWASVPTLDFHYKLFLTPSKYNLSHLSLSFMTFIDRVLLNHGCQYLQKFRLVCGSRTDYSRLYTWICAVIGRGVQEIDILSNTSFIPDCYFPPSLFTCPTLLSLKLRGGKLHFPKLVYLPSLKILHVAPSHLDNDLMQSILRNCPLLEELFIEGEILDKNDTNFDVSSPALKIFNGRFYPHVSTIPQSKIAINAPILESLVLYDSYSPCYLLKNLSSLVKAEVEVGSYNKRNLENKEQGNRIFALLREISRVKYLSLSNQTMEDLNYGDDRHLALFSNLTHLEVSAFNCYGWKSIPELLGGMPNLLVLVLKKSEDVWPNKSVENCNFIEPQVRPPCFSFHLREIEVIGLKGLADELKLIEYFLRNAQALHKMAITSSTSAEEELIRGFFRNLLTIQRVSKTCKIELACRTFNALI